MRSVAYRVEHRRLRNLVTVTNGLCRPTRLRPVHAWRPLDGAAGDPSCGIGRDEELQRIVGQGLSLIEQLYEQCSRCSVAHQHGANQTAASADELAIGLATFFDYLH